MSYDNINLSCWRNCERPTLRMKLMNCGNFPSHSMSVWTHLLKRLTTSISLGTKVRVKPMISKSWLKRSNIYFLIVLARDIIIIFFSVSFNVNCHVYLSINAIPYFDYFHAISSTHSFILKLYRCLFFIILTLYYL